MDEPRGQWAGILTAMGIASGIYVMLWSFGPAIMLLFFREKRRFDLRDARRQAGDAAPATGEQPDTREE